jgi:hypothetical protein
MERVISLHSNNQLMIKSRTDGDDQKWFFDQASKTVKNVKDKTKSIDIRGGTAYGYPTDSRWYQLWKYEGEHFVNE